MPPPVESCCLLIDGHGLLYRAFFAIPVMTTGDGRHTHALFGFIRMLNQVRRCWAPSHLAVVFDAGLPAHRIEQLDTYKAQRPPMPDTLREQMPYIREYLDHAAVPVLAVEGQEADDVMATLTDQFQADHLPVLIVSGDKDLYQLVSDQVALVAASGKPERIGVAEVIKKTGVAPRQIVDWLALTGDTADNIPGVPGVGPKTAARLLNAFGSLDAIWQHIETVRPDGLRASLIAHRAIVDRNVALMTLRRDLPVPLASPADLRTSEAPSEQLQPFFQRYELASMAAPTPAPKPEQGLLNL